MLRCSGAIRSNVAACQPCRALNIPPVRSHAMVTTPRDTTQLAQGAGGRHQQAPPHHRADPKQPDFDLHDAGRVRAGRFGARVHNWFGLLCKLGHQASIPRPALSRRRHPTSPHGPRERRRPSDQVTRTTSSACLSHPLLRAAHGISRPTLEAPRWRQGRASRERHGADPCCGLPVSSAPLQACYDAGGCCIGGQAA